MAWDSNFADIQAVGSELVGTTPQADPSDPDPDSTEPVVVFASCARIPGPRRSTDFLSILTCSAALSTYAAGAFLYRSFIRYR